MTDAEFAAQAVEQARHSRQDPGHVPLFVGALAASGEKLIEAAHRGELEPGEHAEFTLLERKLKGAKLAGATIHNSGALH